MIEEKIRNAEILKNYKEQQGSERMFEKFISGVINQANLLNIIRIIPT